MLTLDEKSLNELNNFLQEMPTKYGLPIINFLNGKIKEQSAVGGTKVEAEVPTAEVVQ
jgi:hypothetical protein